MEKIKKLHKMVGCDITFIDGNHENFQKLGSLNEIPKYNSSVGKVIDGVYHLKRGNIYTIENKTFFVMGGANSIDKHLRTSYVDWWEDELISYSDISKGIDNLNTVNNTVDYVLTHTAPKSIIDLIFRYSKYSPHDDPCSDILESFKGIINFDKWFFGHLHIDCQTYENNKFISLYEEFYKI
jgi:DNA repair exonuclease SbcCD nuclease subunit